MKRTKEEAAQTRKDLIDAALLVFSRKGYHATRLSDIAREAGVTRGAIYHHFGSKADLFMEMIQEASAMFGQVIGQAMAEGGTFEEVGTRVMVNSWVFLEETPRLQQINELLYYKIGDEPDLAILGEMRNEEITRTIDQVQGFIRDAIGRGELPKSLDARAGAIAFLAYLNGMAFYWIGNKEAFSLKENAGALAKILLDGMMAQ